MTKNTYFWKGLGLSFAVLLTLGFTASPARAQHCTDSTVSGTLIGFIPLPGTIEKGNSCNLLPCHEPEENGGSYLDTTGGVARLRVPLKFPGNKQMPTNAHVRVFWFDQASPEPPDEDDVCLPPSLGGSCSPISACGLPGLEILADVGEAWIQIGGCSAILSGGLSAQTEFSLSAYACLTGTGDPAAVVRPVVGQVPADRAHS